MSNVIVEAQARGCALCNADEEHSKQCGKCNEAKDAGHWCEWCRPTGHRHLARVNCSINGLFQEGLCLCHNCHEHLHAKSKRRKGRKGKARAH